MAPEPHVPSAEQQGLASGHCDVALHRMLGYWADTRMLERELSELEGRLESNVTAARSARKSRAADLRLGFDILVSFSCP